MTGVSPKKSGMQRRRNSWTGTELKGRGPYTRPVVGTAILPLSPSFTKFAMKMQPVSMLSLSNVLSGGEPIWGALRGLGLQTCKL